jgi:hypothetical protein
VLQRGRTGSSALGAAFLGALRVGAYIQILQ